MHLLSAYGKNRFSRDVAPIMFPVCSDLASETDKEGNYLVIIKR